MKILIAEAETALRLTMASALMTLGHHVMPVATGAEALRMLQSDDAPSLAILDEQLPEINGAEVCRQIRNELDRTRNSRPLHLILLTERDRSATTAARLVEAGVDDYLCKPFEPEELRARVQIGERFVKLQQELSNRDAAESKKTITDQSKEFPLPDLLEREQLFKAVIEESDASILITDGELDLPGPRVVFVNAAFSRMTGYAASEIIGQTPRILQGAQTDRRTIKRLRQTLERGQRFFGETVNYRKDGSQYNLEWHITPIKTETGAVSHFISVQRDVTERKRWEEALRESREYRNLFNLTSDLLIVFDLQNETILKVNDKACESYRIAREDFVGVSLKSLLANVEDDVRQRRMLENLRRDNASDEFEINHLRSDGTTINLLINPLVVEYEGRQAILAVCRDISDRRLSEINIERAEMEWQTTVDAISDAIILTDPAGIVRRFNRAAADFFGLNDSQLAARQLAELLPRATVSGAAGEVGSQSLQLSETVWEGRLPEREGFYQINRSRMLLDGAQDGDSGWVWIVKNVTARKQSENALPQFATAIEQGFAAAIDQTADAVVIADAVGVIQYVNPTFEQATGWKRDEAVGAGFFDLQARIFGEQLKQQFRDSVSAADGQPSDPSAASLLAMVTSDSAWHGVYKARRRDGEFYRDEVTITPIKDQFDSPQAYVAVCRGMSEQRWLESIAEAVNMMDNIGYVFSGVRHELSNSINSIKTALTVLNNNFGRGQSESTARFIERCLTETGRVEHLLQSLKIFSLYENPQIQSIALGSFVEKFLALIENSYLQRSIRLEYEIGATAGVCRADPRALYQVLLNLVTNAADALVERENPVIKISTERLAAQIAVTVTDNGAGLNESQQANLFKPFYTSKPDGTGLGLVIVKRILGKMDGTISIRSVPEVGTTARFFLPIEA